MFNCNKHENDKQKCEIMIFEWRLTQDSFLSYWCPLKAYLVSELIIRISSSLPLPLPLPQHCCSLWKNKRQNYTAQKHLMNSSLQPFTINSTIITCSVPNQHHSHHNYCEACCCHCSCHTTSETPL